MIKPTSIDLRNASQISVVRGNIDNFLAQMIGDGRPMSASAEARFYYLGPTGVEAHEQITEDSFYGRDQEENPRQPGYYAVEVVRLHDGRTLTNKPFFAVYRDAQSQVQQRDKTVEGGYGDLMEEYRMLSAQHKRELQDQIRKNNMLQTELDTFQVAYNTMRKQSLAFEIERDKAIHDAEHMEHERNLAVARCDELEAEAASFKPQIDQMIDGFTEKITPHVQEMFMAMGGEAFGLGGDGDDAGAGTKKKPPKPPWSGGGGNAANGSGSTRGQAHGSTATGKPTPMSNDPEMPTPEILAHTLYQLFWESENFGRHIHCKQKDELGNPFVPWWIIRGIVFYDQGMDLGPQAIWPSEVRGQGAVADSVKNSASTVDDRAEPSSPKRTQSRVASDTEQEDEPMTVVDMPSEDDSIRLGASDNEDDDDDDDGSEDDARDDADDRENNPPPDDAVPDASKDQPGA